MGGLSGDSFIIKKELKDIEIDSCLQSGLGLNLDFQKLYYCLNVRKSLFAQTTGKKLF